MAKKLWPYPEERITKSGKEYQVSFSNDGCSDQVRHGQELFDQGESDQGKLQGTLKAKKVEILQQVSSCGFVVTVLCVKYTSLMVWRGRLLCGLEFQPMMNL